MVSSSKSHYPSRRSRRTAAVIATSLLTSSVSPVTAFAQDPSKDINTLIQGATGNLLQSQSMPGLPAASPPANGGNETKPSDTAATPSATTPSSPNIANLVPTDVTKAPQDVVDKVAQGMQALDNAVKAPEETFEVEVEGEGAADKAKVTITKKIADPANGKVHLKGENWKNKDNKGSTILVRLKGYDAQTGAETIFKQENPASQQSPADGKAADPEIYWKIEAKEDGTFEGDYDLPKNLAPGQGLKLEFETGAAANDIKRNKTTESLVIGGTEYVEKQAAPALAAPQAMAAAPVRKHVEEKAAEAAAKAAEAESTVTETFESAKAQASAAGSAITNAMAPQAPGGSAEPTDSDKATASTTPSAAPSTQPPAPSTTQTSPSTTPSTSGTASSKTSTPPNNSGTSQSTTASTQPPKDDKKQNDSSSTDTIKDINYLLKEIKNFDKAFENLLGAAALAALSSSGGSNIPGLPGGSNNSTKTTAPTTPRAGGQAGNAGGNKTGTGTSGNGTAGKASTGGTSGGKSTTGGAAAGTKTTQKGTSTNALSGLGSLSSLLGGTGRGTSVGGTRTSGTTTGGATRSTNGTGATRTTTGTNGTSPATGARVINPNTNGRAAAGAAGAGSAKATTSNSASASSKPQPKHTPKPPVKTRDQLTQKNAHGVTGTLKNETLTMKIPRLKSGDWAYLYIYSADTTQKPVGVAWAQLDSTGSVKLDTKDLPDGEYTVAAVDEKDQLVGWVDMKLGEIKNAAVEGDNNDKVVAAQAGVMSATDWWMIGASMLIPLLTASMIYAFRRPRRS